MTSNKGEKDYLTSDEMNITCNFFFFDIKSEIILWITAEQKYIASRVYQSQYVLVYGSEIVINIMKIDKIDTNIFMNTFGPLRLAWARKEVQK